MTTKRTHRPRNDSRNDNEAAAPSAPPDAPPDAAPDSSASTAGGGAEATAAPAATGAPEGAGDDPQAEIAALKERLLRALAEMENTRRRAEREREQAAKYAISAFAREILGIADNLRRTLDLVPPGAIETDEALRVLGDGVALTERELLAIFERHRIRRIEPLGEKFNPEFHHAVFEKPDNNHPPGTVVEVLQVGYLLDDRLLRPAMVAVGKSDGSGEKPPQGIDTIV